MLNLPIPAITAHGVARPSAHGHAAARTTISLSPAAENAALKLWRLREIKSFVAARIAIVKTMTTKYCVIVSTRCCVEVFEVKEPSMLFMSCDKNELWLSC